MEKSGVLRNISSEIETINLNLSSGTETLKTITSLVIWMETGSVGQSYCLRSLFFCEQGVKNFLTSRRVQPMGHKNKQMKR